MLEGDVRNKGGHEQNAARRCHGVSDRIQSGTQFMMAITFARII
jgi:hypothetical protein